MTQTTDTALVRQLRFLSKHMREQNPSRGGFNPVMPHEHTLDQAADTIEAQARRIEALEGEARHASELLLTLCRVTKHRTIDPSVPLAKNMLGTAERLAALSSDPTP